MERTELKSFLSLQLCRRFRTPAVPLTATGAHFSQPTAISRCLPAGIRLKHGRRKQGVSFYTKIYLYGDDFAPSLKNQIRRH